MIAEHLMLLWFGALLFASGLLVGDFAAPPLRRGLRRVRWFCGVVFWTAAAALTTVIYLFAEFRRK